MFKIIEKIVTLVSFLLLSLKIHCPFAYAYICLAILCLGERHQLLVSGVWPNILYSMCYFTGILVMNHLFCISLD